MRRAHPQRTDTAQEAHEVCVLARKTYREVWLPILIQNEHIVVIQLRDDLYLGFNVASTLHVVLVRVRCREGDSHLQHEAHGGGARCWQGGR